MTARAIRVDNRAAVTVAPDTGPAVSPVVSGAGWAASRVVPGHAANGLADGSPEPGVGGSSGALVNRFRCGCV